ncbi:MAG: M2 family metallopeptidase [Clostridiales bacterium]|nr:M2 family metallopeptidase [Clostridiales bacterium]
MGKCRRRGTGAVCVMAAASWLSLASPLEVYGELPVGVEADALAYGERAYERYDPAGLYEDLDRFQGLFAETGNEEEIRSLYGQILEESDRISTLASLAQLKYDQDVTSDTAAAEVEAMGELYREAGDRIYLALRAGLESDYEELLVDLIGEEYVPSVRCYEATPEALKELLSEEERLVTEYDQLAAQELSVTVDGEVWDEDRLAKEAALYSETYYEVQEAMMKEKNRILGEQFLKLVQIRDQMAKEMGYEDYGELAHESIYGRDYSGRDVKALLEGVREEFVPLYDDIYWYYDSSEMNYDLLEALGEGEDESLLDWAYECVSGVDGGLGELFSYMREKGLYDLGLEEGETDRNTGTYTLSLPQYGDAFIFLSRSGGVYDHQSLIHEFGHFAAGCYDEVPELFQDYYVDVSEIQSQGLELLAAAWARENKGELGEVYAYEEICTMVSNVLSACMIGEFEQAVYENPDMTLEELNKLFSDIQDTYENAYIESYDGTCYGWVEIGHLFSSPMYYIGYGTSALSALDLWVDAGTESLEAASGTYMSLIKEGSHMPYCQTAEKWELTDVFSTEELGKLADGIRAIEGAEEGDYDSYEPETGEIDAVRLYSNTAIGILVIVGGFIMVLQLVIIGIGIAILVIVSKRKES